MFRKYSRNYHFYVLVQGHLKVSQRGQIINQLSQGDLLGEISLFVSAGRRSATIQALNDCVLLEIGRDDFLSYFKPKFIPRARDRSFSLGKNPKR